MFSFFSFHLVLFVKRRRVFRDTAWTDTRTQEAAHLELFPGFFSLLYHFSLGRKTTALSISPFTFYPKVACLKQRKSHPGSGGFIFMLTYLLYIDTNVLFVM